ncbi:hypothetical protein ACB087_12730 [Vibrio sp. VNB-15]
MTLTLNPHHLVCDTFGNLETFNPQWLTQQEHWEGFMQAFFESNGLTYNRVSDSRVQACIDAEDKAAFSSMIDTLLPRLTESTNIQGVNTVLMAHWTPDLHLGTSVVNHAIHRLNLNEDCFGLAISDRGLSAPLFALACLERHLDQADEEALLLIADQKNLLYKSPLMTRLSPRNSACVLKVEHNGIGWRYRGYRKVPQVSPTELAETIQTLITEFELASDVTVIADQTCLNALPNDHDHLATDSTLLCSAPFFTLQAQGRIDRDYLLVVYEQDTVYAVGLQGEEASCD